MCNFYVDALFCPHLRPFALFQRAENGRLDASWLNLALLGRPDFQSRGPKNHFKLVFWDLWTEIGAPQKRQTQPRRIQSLMRTCVCARLASFAPFCVRPRFERRRLGISETEKKAVRVRKGSREGDPQKKKEHPVAPTQPKESFKASFWGITSQGYF